VEGLNVSEGEEEAAMQAQKHPTIFCWPKGGLEDNPMSQWDRDSVHWYDDVLAKASPAERKVRLKGGFASLNASPVFDRDAVEEIRLKSKPWLPGTIGMLVPSPTPRRVLGPVKNSAGNLVANPLAADFVFQPGASFPGGVITIYSMPEVDEQYAMGADFGAGLDNRDWDCCVVIGQKSKRQVAQARGRWGDINFAWVLWSLGWFYNEALIVGERQFGLPVMRRLYDEWGYVYQYIGADDESKQTPRKSDLLGHHRYHGDLVIPRMQWAIAPMEVDKAGRPTGKRTKHIIQFVDPILIGELEAYEWHPKRKDQDIGDTTAPQLTCGAPGGMNDDCVMAGAYAVMGYVELPRFLSKKAPITPGSLGEMLGHEKILREMERAKNPVHRTHKFGVGVEEKRDQPAWPPF
jgi:hypothetical protein